MLRFLTEFRISIPPGVSLDLSVFIAKGIMLLVALSMFSLVLLLAYGIIFGTSVACVSLGN